MKKKQTILPTKKNIIFPSKKIIEIPKTNISTNIFEYPQKMPVNQSYRNISVNAFTSQKTPVMQTYYSQPYYTIQTINNERTSARNTTKNTSNVRFNNSANNNNNNNNNDGSHTIIIESNTKKTEKNNK